MNLAIDESQLDGAELVAARQSVRTLTTAMRIANSDGHPGQIIAQELVAGFVERQADGLFNDAAQSGANAGHAVNAFVDDLLPSGGGGSASSYQQAINSVVDQMGQTLTPNALASGSVAGLEVMAVSYTHLTLPTIYSV